MIFADAAPKGGVRWRHGVNDMGVAGRMMGKDLWNEAAEQQAARRKAEPSRPAVAVALSYDPAQADAPVVVASGQGALAEQILNLAFANGVKVRTDPDLVQVLAAVDVDTVIPLEAFAAVAEILAYVYRANGVAPPAAPETGTDPTGGPS